MREPTNHPSIKGPLDTGRARPTLPLSCGTRALACPRAGFWFTPARLDSRRHFTQDEPMPDMGGDYGATIWQ